MELVIKVTKVSFFELKKCGCVKVEPSSLAITIRLSLPGFKYTNCSMEYAVCKINAIIHPMNSIESNPIKKDLPFYTECIQGAYDLSSCGLGPYRHSFLKLAQHQPLDEMDQSNIATYDSNYLCDPYVYGWQYPQEFFAILGPQHISPYTDRHLQLLAHTSHEYHALRWDAARNAFSLIGYNAEISPEDLEGDIISYILKISDKFDVERYDAIFKSSMQQGENELRLQRAARHKLGCMLAVTEQILYDTAAAGIPIGALYKPEGERLAKNWQKHFGEDVPTIGELVEQTVSTFRQFADPEDELTRHLLEADFNPSQFLS